MTLTALYEGIGLSPGAAQPIFYTARQYTTFDYLDFQNQNWG